MLMWLTWPSLGLRVALCVPGPRASPPGASPDVTPVCPRHPHHAFLLLLKRGSQGERCSSAQSPGLRPGRPEGMVSGALCQGLLAAPPSSGFCFWECLLGCVFRGSVFGLICGTSPGQSSWRVSLGLLGARGWGFSLLQIARVWTCLGRGPVDAGHHFFSPGEGLGAPRALAYCPHTELSSGLCLLFCVLAPIKRFLVSLFLG